MRAASSTTVVVVVVEALALDGVRDAIGGAKTKPARVSAD